MGRLDSKIPIKYILFGMSFLGITSIGSCVLFLKRASIFIAAPAIEAHTIVETKSRDSAITKSEDRTSQKMDLGFDGLEELMMGMPGGQNAYDKREANRRAAERRRNNRHNP